MTTSQKIDKVPQNAEVDKKVKVNKVPLKKKFNDGSRFLQQIMAIENHGCNGLKCHNCCLQNLCPRIPAVAKNVAAKILAEAYASLTGNKDKSKNV